MLVHSPAALARVGHQSLGGGLGSDLSPFPFPIHPICSWEVETLTSAF